MADMASKHKDLADDVGPSTSPTKIKEVVDDHRPRQRLLLLQLGRGLG
jgi:hypothetical protein